MSKKRAKSSKRWQTREFFISSMLVILVISGLLFSGWLLTRESRANRKEVSEAWLDENIWRVVSYKEKKNGKYEVYLLSITPAVEETFEDLKETFLATTYSATNTDSVVTGVNCQGMTVYLADWCERHKTEYCVAWTTIHTYTFIFYDDQWYKFDFDSDGATCEEVPPGEVQKGMIVE